MKIIFNWLALLEYGILFIGGIITSFLLKAAGVNNEMHKLISKIVAVALLVVVIIVGDFLYRLSNVKRSNEKIYKVLSPNRGGHIFFIPSFLYGVFVLYLVIFEGV